MQILCRTAFFLLIFISCLIYFTSLFTYLTACQSGTVQSNNTTFLNLLSPQKPNLCKNIESSDFISSKNIKNSKIAIVLTVNGSLYNFTTAISTTKCYATHFGYQWHLLNSTIILKYANSCNQTDFYFKRHCILAKFMEENKKTIEYVLYIDADMAVINPCHRIQDYIDDDPGIEMIFYERYFDFEYAAGSFLIRNSLYSISVLKYWSEYFFRLPKSFHGTDNGAIHQVFMDLNFNETSKRNQCYDLWEISENYEDLFTFQACTKDALSKTVPFIANKKIKVIQKMSPGWVRDGWLTNTSWSSEDFMLHGFKEAEISIGKWEFPFTDIFNMSKCHHGDATFPNFKYAKKFVSTEENVRNMLGFKSMKVHTDYVNYLRKIQLIRLVQSKAKNKLNLTP